MSRRQTTIPADVFDGMYMEPGGDPWGFRSSDYERAKYVRTLNALERDTYDNALEVGCSIGVFTAMLAPRCDRLLAIDGSAVALATAREALGGVPNLTLDQRMVPDEFPAGSFPLIILSEVLYYLTLADLGRVAEQCFAAQPAGGEMILCHWLGETDYPLTGQEAQDAFVALATARGYRHAVLNTDVYRLDRLLSP